MNVVRPAIRFKIPPKSVSLKRNRREHPKRNQERSEFTKDEEIEFLFCFSFCLQIVNDRCTCRPYLAIRDALIYGGSCVYSLPLNASASYKTDARLGVLRCFKEVRNYSFQGMCLTA
ncbi:hypothetical protein TNCV_1102711 [Trichonephila clavipes]|nr:hypothetical protein TNCV_1102711 [Trichonephila clavipes]